MATIIAELCQNHKGDKKLVSDMIAAAADAGADYAKIQTIRADDLTKRERFEEGVVENGETKVIKRPYDPEYARLKPMDLSDDDHRWFIEECKRFNIKPLTTAFTRGSIPFLASLEWDAIKVASYDCASYPMIKELREAFSTLFISTGATYDEEIEKTSEILKGHDDYTFLHCVTIYPTPLDAMNLARLEFLKKYAPKVGFSDHSLVERDGIKASVAAIAHGAEVIERHFTILEKDETKDGPVSIKPDQLRELVEFGKKPQQEVLDYVSNEYPEYPSMIGVKTRPLSHAELLNRDYYRGRFASKVNAEYVYNWEDTLIS
ncbi:MAG: general stress protein [Ectothiorhodospiraceae bacterium]|nr:general stress protein [Ectothiorhodospiraceae bacterium]